MRGKLPPLCLIGIFVQDPVYHLYTHITPGQYEQHCCCKMYPLASRASITYNNITHQIEQYMKIFGEYDGPNSTMVQV